MAPIDGPPGYTVAGTVTGFAGRELVLQLNGGDDVTITADGAFVFPTRLPGGSAYMVTVKTAPVCPQRVCTIANATGAITDANANNVNVTCAAPRYRLGSLNWGDDSIRVTDDVQALSNNGTAAPRIITGAKTGLGGSEIDNLAFDSVRDLIYVAGVSPGANAFTISAFANASSAAGNVEPQRQFLVSGEPGLHGIELDAEADRLYVAGESGTLRILDEASTLDGTATPTHSIPLASPGAITLDRINDRLYVSPRTPGVHVFDNARQLTSASTPSRSATWASNDFPRTVAIDGCRDRLYVGNRGVSTSGVNIYVLDAASALSGTIDIETAAAARLTVPDDEIMSSVIDSSGAFYFWNDSATQVRIVNAPESFTGTVTVVPDKTVTGVVSRGYGLDVVSY